MSNTRGKPFQKQVPSFHKANPSAALWIYGWHTVVHALSNSQRRWEALWVTSETWKRLQDVPGLKLQGNPHVTVVDTKALEARLGRHVVHQGIALHVHSLSPMHLEDLEPFDQEGTPHLVILLDHVEDPQNLGTIIRTSAVFQAQALVLTERHAPPLSPTVQKAASGGIEHLPIIQVVNLVRAIEHLKRCGFWVIGLAEEGESVLSSMDLKRPTVLVMGSEGSGLRTLTKKACDILARLPASAQFSTLNVSSALAVSAYEWVRQNRT